MARTHVVCLIIAASVLGTASAARVAYSDGGSFIQSTAPDVLTPDGVSGVLASLLSAETSAHSKPGVSQEVEKVVSTDVFHRPAAVLAVQVIGTGDAPLLAGEGAAAPRSLGVDADASTLLRVVAEVASGGPQSFVYSTLDHEGLPEECGERCQEIMVKKVMEARGYNYTEQTQPSWDCDAGPWCYWVMKGDEQVLNMGMLEDRMLAYELGLLRHKAFAAAAAQKAGDGAAKPPKLLEATLLGMQALRTRYGADSRKFAAALGMLRGTLAEAFEVLREAHRGEVVAQVATAELATADAKLNELMAWRTQHRVPFQRRLLQQGGQWVAQDFGALSVHWATSSVAWLISIIILIFIISSAICLCNMSFEHDSLLYAAKKTD